MHSTPSRFDDALFFCQQATGRHEVQGGGRHLFSCPEAEQAGGIAGVSQGPRCFLTVIRGPPDIRRPGRNGHTTLCCVLSQQLVAILREFTQTKNTNLTACMGRIHLKVSQNIPDTFLPPVVGLCPGWKAKERFARTCSRPWSKGDAHTSRIGLKLCVHFRLKQKDIQSDF